MGGNLYNEPEPFAAQWLRNLSTAGHIAQGAVDERSIKDLKATDLEGLHQFHAFAGIGAWSHALRLAGVPDSTPVWTGSCPCQPFSNAGKRGGTSDPRHLWPDWLALIAECRPSIIFGEQVASPTGRAWLSTVRSDLEALGYAVGSADLCAAGAGAPHIRQRLWFGAVRLADAIERGRKVRRDPAGHRAEAGEREASGAGDGVQVDNPWRDADWLHCRDAKWRPVEPGTFPLADGAPGRVGRLRAYGNAIVPQIAATFIRAFIEATLAHTPTTES